MIILTQDRYFFIIWKRQDDALEFVWYDLPINPFAPRDFAEKHVLKLVEWFSGHCRAIKR